MPRHARVLVLLLSTSAAACASPGTLSTSGPFDIGHAPDEGLRYFLTRDLLTVDAKVSQFREVVRGRSGACEPHDSVATSWTLTVTTVPDRRQAYRLGLTPSGAARSDTRRESERDRCADIAQLRGHRPARRDRQRHRERRRRCGGRAVAWWPHGRPGYELRGVCQSQAASAVYEACRPNLRSHRAAAGARSRRDLVRDRATERDVHARPRAVHARESLRVRVSRSGAHERTRAGAQRAERGHRLHGCGLGMREDLLSRADHACDSRARAGLYGSAKHHVRGGRRAHRAARLGGRSHSAHRLRQPGAGLRKDRAHVRRSRERDRRRAVVERGAQRRGCGGDLDRRERACRLRRGAQGPHR